MRDPERQVAALAARVPTVTTETAIFERFEGALCIVTDAQGVEQAWAWSGQWPPQPGDAVRVEQRAGRHIVTGTVLPKPTRGTVAAVASTTLMVDVGGPGLVEVVYNKSAYPDPAVGHIVQLVWGVEGGIATGQLSLVPLPPPAPEPSEPVATAPVRQTFRATVAGSWWRGDWGSGRPKVSDNNVAGYHYGSVLGATLPDGATITRARIYLPTEQVLYPLAPFIQAFDGPPPASAGVGPTSVLGARSGWVEFDTAVAAQLRTGNRGIRLGLQSHPTDGTYDIYKSLASDPMSGALDLTWKA